MVEPLSITLAVTVAALAARRWNRRPGQVRPGDPGSLQTTTDQAVSTLTEERPATVLDYSGGALHVWSGP